MVVDEKERKSQDEVLRGKNVKHLVPRCETQGEAGLHTLLLQFKSILACASNGEKAPEELICMGTLIFFFLGDHLCPFWRRQRGVYQFPGPQSGSEDGERRHQKQMKMCEMWGTSQAVWGPQNKMGRALEWDNLLLFAGNQFGSDLKGLKGTYVFGQLVCLQIWEEVQRTRSRKAFGNGIPSKSAFSGAVAVPAEEAGVDFSSTHTSRVQGSSGTPGCWGEGRALLVGTISEQTELLLGMYLPVSQGRWALGTSGVPWGPTRRIPMYNLTRRHLPRTRQDHLRIEAWATKVSLFRQT